MQSPDVTQRNSVAVQFRAPTFIFKNWVFTNTDEDENTYHNLRAHPNRQNNLKKFMFNAVSFSNKKLMPTSMAITSPHLVEKKNKGF